MIFPGFKEKRFGYVNLDAEARTWAKEKNLSHDPNPLLDPVTCARMVEDVHAKYGVDFSYGGWMEDRSFLWHGNYLEKSGGFVHLGVDLNAPTGTEVAIDFDAEIVRVDDDYPDEGGWGPRVIVRHAKEPIYMIYAHLDRDILCKVGDTVKKGEIFAKIGKPPFNGNWFPHLHVQSISEPYFNDIEKRDAWSELDGYGAASNVHENARRFPDPLRFISLT